MPLSSAVPPWLNRPTRRMMVAVQRDKRVGTQIGNYYLEALVGRGGMGVVYRARHTISGRRVAVKLMAPNLAEDEDFRRRFLREADFSPLLDHPNVVSVFEAGSHRGVLFLAMDFVEGTDLKTLIGRRPLDPARLAFLLSQAAGALDAAHQSGVVHRDVKPQNILIGPNDHAYVTDFGLIKRISSESSLSLSGQVLGSVHYMAPEQVEGKRIDGRVDVYSLGCVAYECLTGDTPFDRELEVAVLWAHVHADRPAVSERNPGVPSEVDRVVAKAMATEPNDRYMTCGDLVGDLMVALGTEALAPSQRAIAATGRFRRRPRRATTSYDSHPRERRLWAPSFFSQRLRVHDDPRGAWTKAAVVILALSLAAVTFVRDGGLPQAVSDVAGTVSNVAGAVGELLPEDGDSPGVTSAEGARGERSRHERSRGGRHGMTGDPDNSARGGSISLHLGDTLTGGSATPGSDSKSSAGRGTDPTQLIAYAASTESGNLDIHAVGTDGSNATRLTSSPLDEMDPEWSPDGQWIAFVSLKYSGGVPAGVGDLYVMRADGSGLRQLTNDGNVERFPTWSANGKRIAYTKSSSHGQDSAIWIMKADGSEPVRLVEGWDPAWSPDGKWIAYVDYNDGRQIIFRMRAGNPDTAEALSTPSSSADEWHHGPRWSPDGRRIAFFKTVRDWTSGGNPMDVMGIMRSDGSRVRWAGDGSDPAWSPNGKKIAYSTYPQGAELWVMSPDGSERKLVVPRGRYTYLVSPSWRPRAL